MDVVTSDGFVINFSHTPTGMEVDTFSLDLEVSFIFNQVNSLDSLKLLDADQLAHILHVTK